PCLRLAYQALAKGGNMPAVLNAANEVAVESFLTGRMSFTAIPDMIEHVMSSVSSTEIDTLDDVLAADSTARLVAQEWLLCKV
ncbi:MAG TPA: 1-deoxy-D-xylulose-5-phosphate reductoisomerase, partial [Nitrosomonas sp.]|nr:1-deoxy-D-xylulose-5-phosphate reductoisomerase [Nitrosomonas sp.]